MSLSLDALAIPSLQPMTLELPAGECLSLAGASGCGKTRLLRAIADLDPHQGVCRLCGQSAQDMEPTQWRRRVALVPAETAWWGGRVRDYLSGYPLDSGLRPLLTLDDLGLPVDCLDWEVAHLSSGERQRLGLLRGLRWHPEVLLLDEPTANLDQANGLRLERLVKRYQDERSAVVIWVTHQVAQQQRVAGRHAEICDGRLVVWS